MSNPSHSKDQPKAGRSQEQRGRASPGGSGTPPDDDHQAAGRKGHDVRQPEPARQQHPPTRREP